MYSQGRGGSTPPFVTKVFSLKDMRHGKRLPAVSECEPASISDWLRLAAEVVASPLTAKSQRDYVHTARSDSCAHAVAGEGPQSGRRLRPARTQSRRSH